MTGNKKTIDFGYTKTILKTDQNNPVVKEYVDAMKRGTNPNPTEKRECWCKDFKYEGLGGRTDNLDCPVHHPVESWREEFRKEFGFIGHKGIQCDEITVANLLAFISSQIQQAEERLVERIHELRANVPPYPMEGNKAGEITWAAKRGYSDALDDILASIKEEK